MNAPFEPPPRTWPQKLGDAFAAALTSLRSESSFRVHLFFALLVAVCGAVFRVSLVEACLLVMCVFFVFSMEMINTALERLAKAVDQQENPHLCSALNTGSAAVLTAALGAVIVGTVVFVFRLGVMVGWWGA